MDQTSKLRDAFLSGLDANALNGLGDVPLEEARQEIEAVLDAFLKHGFPHWSPQTKQVCRQSVVAEIAGLSHEELASLVREQYPAEVNIARKVVAPAIVVCLLLPLYLVGACFVLAINTIRWFCSRIKFPIQGLADQVSDEEIDLWRSAKLLVNNYWPRAKWTKCLCCSASGRPS